MTSLGLLGPQCLVSSTMLVSELYGKSIPRKNRSERDFFEAGCGLVINMVPNRFHLRFNPMILLMVQKFRRESHLGC